MVEGVVVAHDAAADDGDGEADVATGEGDLEDEAAEAESKECEKHRVHGERGSVVEVGVLDGAGGEGAGHEAVVVAGTGTEGEGFHDGFCRCDEMMRRRGG